MRTGSEEDAPARGWMYEERLTRFSFPVVRRSGISSEPVRGPEPLAAADKFAAALAIVAEFTPGRLGDCLTCAEVIPPVLVDRKPGIGR